jgi:hypothetical protein
MNKIRFLIGPLTQHYSQGGEGIFVESPCRMLFMNGEFQAMFVGAKFAIVDPGNFSKDDILSVFYARLDQMI